MTPPSDKPDSSNTVKRSLPSKSSDQYISIAANKRCAYASADYRVGLNIASLSDSIELEALSGTAADALSPAYIRLSRSPAINSESKAALGRSNEPWTVPAAVRSQSPSPPALLLSGGF